MLIKVSDEIKFWTSDTNFIPHTGLRKALIGSDGGEEPWRYCVTDTNNMLGFAIGAMFVREVFNGDSKPQAEEMINEIRFVAKSILLKNTFHHQISITEPLSRGTLEI